MVLWTHLLGRKRDPIPVDLPPRLLQEKQVAAQPPSLHVSGTMTAATAWEEAFKAVYATLLLNLQMPDVLSKIRYAHPAPAFRGVYLWDSAFIAQVWNHWDPGVAWDVNAAVLALAEEGRVQHVVADFVESRYTQPPLLGWSILRCVQQSDWVSSDELQKQYLILQQYHEWLRKHRQLENGLFAWAHPYESGIDNSPRFSTRDESAFADTSGYAAPDFSSYVVLQAEALAGIADRLERPQEAAQRRAFAGKTRDAINRYLWHEDDGLYYDLDTATGNLLRHNTIAGLLPMWAGVPHEQQAARLLEHILNREEYNTPVPLPTVARNDAGFVKDMWRGPVWINTAYAVIQGMLRYGFYEEAGELAFRLCDGVYRTFENCRRVFEFYDPERLDIEQLHRKKGNRWKRLTLGGKPVTEFVGWSGLVNTLAIEVIAGVTQHNGETVLRPLPPRSTIGDSFSVRLPARGLAVTVERTHDDRVIGAIRAGGAVTRFNLAIGQRLPIEITRNRGVDAETGSVGLGADIPINGPHTGAAS